MIGTNAQIHYIQISMSYECNDNSIIKYNYNPSNFKKARPWNGTKSPNPDPEK